MTDISPVPRQSVQVDATAEHLGIQSPKNSAVPAPWRQRAAAGFVVASLAFVGLYGLASIDDGRTQDISRGDTQTSAGTLPDGTALLYKSYRTTSSDGKCDKYTGGSAKPIEAYCDWTAEWNCPGQGAGSLGKAGTRDTAFHCCCELGMWKDAGSTCAAIDIGTAPAGGLAGVVMVPPGYICPATIDKNNWLQNTDGPDTFAVEQNLFTSPDSAHFGWNTIRITRTDSSDGGWGMDLKIQCCNLCTHVDIGTAPPGGLQAPVPVAQSYTCPVSVDRYSWLQHTNGPDTFTLDQDILGDNSVSVQRTDPSDGGWGMDLKIQCCATYPQCSAYDDGQLCGWTQEYNCPGQAPGTKGTATPDKTDGYYCCCNQGLWRDFETNLAVLDYFSFVGLLLLLTAPVESRVSHT
jgi:hypothetical protein